PPGPRRRRWPPDRSARDVAPIAVPRAAHGFKEWPEAERLGGAARDRSPGSMRREDGGPDWNRYGLAGLAGAGSTLMNLPIRPRSWNFTTPSIRANSESSRPRPTLWPGLKRVPRWRTRMDPPVTNWPPNRLTPRRWELLSRPFLELPPAFLWAIPSPRRS